MNTNITTAAHSPEFGINDANGYFIEIVKPQYDDFLENNASRRYAILAILVTYHLFEWVHSGQKFTIEFFERTYPNDIALAKSFELARNIANGTKHFLQKTETRRQSGFSSGFTEGFARPLVVKHPDGEEQSVDKLLHDMMDFWTRFLPQTEQE